MIVFGDIILGDHVIKSVSPCSINFNCPCFSHMSRDSGESRWAKFPLEFAIGKNVKLRSK